jgi:4-hydroxy-2-oxoheptanedioate aldolase
MDVPVNRFKQALREGKPQIGLWLALGDAISAELCAGAGFDWLVLDAEHGPNDLRSLLAQMQAVAPYPSHPVVRIRVGDPHIIKQVLEVGAQTMLIPMVETAEQAASLVAAMQYPPAGFRGVGSALGRSSRWNRMAAYPQQAGNEMCLLVQIETRRGVENIKAIAATPGVDGVFIGPADLSASMSHLGNMTHPDVLATIEQCIGHIRAAGKAPGILFGDEALVKRYLELGVLFIAVSADTLILSQGTDRMAARFKGLVK